jgi:hypothetical protein
VAWIFHLQHAKEESYTHEARMNSCILAFVVKNPKIWMRRLGNGVVCQIKAGNKSLSQLSGTCYVDEMLLEHIILWVV